jgi:hypothetical protein
MPPVTAPITGSLMQACQRRERDARGVTASRRLQRPPELAHMFDRVADGYEARPGYPTAVFDILSDRCGLGAGARVLEIGPGAGKRRFQCSTAARRSRPSNRERRWLGGSLS